jgi:UDP-N-acetylmuramoyl-tripeptide--D-alanyl-D-alanine ligase
MEPRSLEFIRSAVSGRLTGSGTTIVTGLSTDSRSVRPGDCFIAVRGDKFDGHDFATDVIDRGASAVIVAENRVPQTGFKSAFITVPDTRRALGELAARYRNDFTLPIVAVAGSNGKTTTKELIASVLRRKHATLWSEASFNNDIGVPLTLLRLEKNHTAAVLELGTNHPGELAPLIRMVEPEIGVITSIGREHLEFFGDLAGVVEEEGWLAELLPSSGTLFVNGDSEWAPEIARRSKARVTSVGRHGDNDWVASDLSVGENGVSFAVRASEPEFSGKYSIGLLGAHQITNALLALAVGAHLGVAPEELRSGLAEAQPPKMRLQFWETNGVRVLDDAYNANVDSMMAALQTLHDLPSAGRRVAVLGDMAELGEHTEAAHIEVGRRVAELGIDQLFTIGRWADQTAMAARTTGLQEVRACSDIDSVVIELKKFVRPGDLLLLKASRAAGLERVSAALKKNGNV